MGRAVEVAIGVLLDGGGQGRQRVLISRRPSTGTLGGYWEFPGGKREPDESLEACLVREFHEELGLAVRVGEPLPVVEHAYEHARVRLCPFFCYWQAGEPQPLAVSAVRWIEPCELKDYMFPPANAAVLEAIHAALDTRSFS